MSEAVNLLRSRIEALNTRLDSPEGLSVLPSELFDGAGLREIVNLPPLAAGGFRPLNPPTISPVSNIEVQVLNMRLSLGMLAQSFGARNNFAVLKAQSNANTDALVITRGTATLADLKLFMQHYRLQTLDIGGDFVAAAPVIVLPGATLRLGEGEVLNLSRPDGAFVVNFGHLDINGAEIRSVGGENVGTPSFAPFVVTALQGTAHVQKARFSGLGFGQTRKFSGFSILRNALLPVSETSFIRDSVFDGVRSVSIYAVRDIDISGNRFHNAVAGPLEIARAPNALIKGNLFTGEMQTNAIRLILQSRNAKIEGNVILGGENAGITINTGSDNVTLAHNLIWRRNGGGIRVVKSDCGLVHDNIVIDNRQKGIEVRTSQGSEVAQNLIVGNNSAGIWVSAQTWQANTTLRENVLFGNGSGIGTAIAEELTLIGNDFSGQFPQFLSGDLAQQNRHIAGDVRGRNAVVLSADGVAAQSSGRPPVCGVF
jgi:poly(beta-D-mannuronate) C5 epimerase